MKNRDDLGPMAGGATVAATPLKARGALTYLFTLYDISNQLIGEKLNELHSGDSYTQTEFAVDGAQPSTTNPMGNPTLGEYYTTEQVGLRYSQFHIGTGTTSGGTNWVGYLTTLYNDSPVLNYNFAVGGATIDNSIVDTKVKDVTSQVRDFELAYGKKPISAPWSSDNAVFAFWIGTNDIGWGHQNTQPSIPVPTLMAQYKCLIEKIYASGGRKFLFLNVPPTDRSPMIIKEGPEAVKAYATWVKAYNNGLQSMIDVFKSSYTDTNRLLSFFTIRGPLCRRSWTILRHMGSRIPLVLNEDGMSCIWWNHYHPGQNFYKLQAADMIQYLQPLGAW
ncbi:unnamed protein product [Penicillium nalgiovense]|nr:unnamed protein product [Penicillium nalgiovense]